MTHTRINWEAFTECTTEPADVRLLGLVDAPSVLALQKLMVHEVRQQSRVHASVLICEHPPVLTAGRDASLLDLPTDSRVLESRSLRVHRVRRDGGTFLHQPGQLAVYVVVSLNDCGFDEHQYRLRLQSAVMATFQDAQVKTHIREGDPCAVFGRHGIVAEIGIQVEQGVTSFGAFLNIGCSLDDARMFGRGLRGDRISSMNAERVRPSLMPQVRTSLISHVCNQIGYPEYHIHTGHPFLTRKRP